MSATRWVHRDLRQLVDWELALRIGVQTGVCYVDNAVRIRLHQYGGALRQAPAPGHSDALDLFWFYTSWRFQYFEPVRRAAATRAGDVRKRWCVPKR